ncbi:MAG TPA: hypothetical protein VJ343_01910 [archaeon]|nr:hypothetical protein [archaeon]
MPVPHVVTIILCLLAVILVLGLLFTQGKNWAFAMLENYAPWLADYFESKGAAEIANFQNAMECAYHRCTEGCNNMPQEIKDLEICVEMEDGACKDEEPKKCKEDFCDPFKDSQSKVCDGNAMAHPVTVSISTSVEIDRDFMVKLFGRASYGPDDQYSVQFAQTDCEIPKSLAGNVVPYQLVVPYSAVCSEPDFWGLIGHCTLEGGGTYSIYGYDAKTITPSYGEVICDI